MPNRYSKAARDAADLTNKQLGELMATFGPLSEEKLRELLPTKKEKEEFSRLMALVEKEAEVDKQLAYLSNNLQATGKVIFKVLKYFA